MARRPPTGLPSEVSFPIGNSLRWTPPNAICQLSIRRGTVDAFGRDAIMNRADPADGDFTYTSVAVYYEDSDSLEYVRRDEPSVYRRIDDLLTLVLSMRTREPLGFQLKGFRHFYLQYIKDKLKENEAFPQLIIILEEAVKRLGNEVFSEREKLSAYIKARDIAKEDDVTISELQICA
jgi:hypothetical protein